MIKGFPIIFGEALSGHPLQFFESEFVSQFSLVMQLVAFASLDFSLQRQWQIKQIKALSRFASDRSPFWRDRLYHCSSGSDFNLDNLSRLSKADLRRQFESENCLLRKTDRIPIFQHQTSGSSGVPTRFYISEFNRRYNGNRSLAQYFIENRDLCEPRTQLKLSFGQTGEITVKKGNSWIGSLSKYLHSGASRIIEHSQVSIGSKHSDLLVALKAEIESDRIGTLVANAWTIRCLVETFGINFLKENGLALWVPFGSSPETNVREIFEAANIPVRGTYSAEEVGTIGFECKNVAGSYHVNNSNVWVEQGDEQISAHDGTKIGSLLITHLHSYATPFLRYDIGDLGRVRPMCECGYIGPSITHLMGRGRSRVIHSNGNITPFLFRLREEQWLAKYNEFRFIQTALDHIVVEVGSEAELTESEIELFIDFVQRAAAGRFNVEVRSLREIDWGANRKKEMFYSQVLAAGEFSQNVRLVN